MKEITVKRKTAETDIELTLAPGGKIAVATGCGFLDHMLTLFAFHASLGLAVKCAGDTDVDYHHTVEDVALALGKALSDSLDSRVGIARYGSIALPMDEALVLVALDLSGRSGAYIDCPLPTEKIGDFDAELIAEFFTALARAGLLTLHVRKLAGANSHHIAEAAFKGLGRALRQALSPLEGLASTKGMLV